MKKNTILSMWLFACIMVIFISCTKDEPDADSYIMFKYDDIEYKITGDCDFANSADMNYVISGKEKESDKLFIMNIGYTIEKGHAYDIYNSSPPYESAAISILFIDGEEFAEQSYVADKVGIIGQLIITEKTDERLSGTFSCRMLNGELTDGKFSVKAKIYN